MKMLDDALEFLSTVFIAPVLILIVLVRIFFEPMPFEWDKLIKGE